MNGVRVSLKKAAHPFSKECVDDANYTIQHDILSLSTIELLIAPEY